MNIFSSRNTYWLIWVISILFYFFENIIRTSPNASAPILVELFQMDNLLLGKFSAAYLTAYAILQIPVGIYLDRFGIYKTFIIGVSLCILGFGILFIANSSTQLIIGQFLIGAGFSFDFLVCLHSAASLPSKHFGAFYGLTSTIGSIGSYLGTIILPFIFSMLGFDTTYFLFLAVSSLFLLSMFLLFNYRKKQFIEKIQISEKNHFQKLKKLALNPQIILNSLYAGTLGFIQTTFAILWGLSLINAILNLDMPNAYFIIFSVFLGIGTGNYFFGWLHDKIKKCRSLMYISSFILIIHLIILFFPLNGSVFFLSYLLFGIGFFSSSSVLAFIYVKSHFPDQDTGYITGIVNTVTILFGALSQPLIGYVLTPVNHGIINSTLFTPNFRGVLTILLIIACLNLLISFFIHEADSTDPTCSLSANNYQILS